MNKTTNYKKQPLDKLYEKFRQCKENTCFSFFDTNYNFIFKWENKKCSLNKNPLIMKSKEFKQTITIPNNKISDTQLEIFNENEKWLKNLFKNDNCFKIIENLLINYVFSNEKVTIKNIEAENKPGKDIEVISENKKKHQKYKNQYARTKNTYFKTIELIIFEAFALYEDVTLIRFAENPFSAMFNEPITKKNI